MRLKIKHTTTYSYDPDPSGVAMRLRLFPTEFEAQITRDWIVTVNGQTVSRLLTDGFGDGVGLWHVDGPVSVVEIGAEGTVETIDRSGIVSGLPRRPVELFLRPTPLTKPDDAIRDLAESVNEGSPLQKAHALMSVVHEAVQYKTQVTGTETTAIEALRLGFGVCQDQSHVFIAAARQLGLPSRYVTGYLHAGEEDHVPVATHAWSELFIKDIGWIGFDVTNKVCPTDRYVRLCAGLDAQGAAPIRGSCIGQVESELKATVTISQEGAAQSQSQSQQTGEQSQSQGDGETAAHAQKQSQAKRDQ